MGDKIKCYHILVKKQSEALMIMEKLKKGEGFANLAKEFSIDKGSGKKGGDLGFFGRGMMVKPFEEAAFKLKKGEITPEPIKTEFGYHIIKRSGWYDFLNRDYLIAENCKVDAIINSIPYVTSKLYIAIRI